jgi:hypothetical protein
MKSGDRDAQQKRQQKRQRDAQQTHPERQQTTTPYGRFAAGSPPDPPKWTIHGQAQLLAPRWPDVPQHLAEPAKWAALAERE